MGTLNIISKRQGVLCRPDIHCVCPLNILQRQLCGFTSLLVLMLKLNPPLSPVWLIPEHYRQIHTCISATRVRERSSLYCGLCVCEAVGVCMCVCVSHLVELSEVVYCTAALPTDGHYHTVANSTQGRDQSKTSATSQHCDICALHNVHNEIL